MGCEGKVYGPRVPFCGDTTGLNSIAIWQRNVYLILFLIACLVTNVVLWMRRECFYGRARHLETNRYILSVTVKVRTVYVAVAISGMLTLTRRSLSLTRCGTGRSAPASSREYRAGSRTMRRCSPPRSSSSSSSSTGSTSATLADAYSLPCIARYAKRVPPASALVPHVIRRVYSGLPFRPWHNCSRW